MLLPTSLVGSYPQPDWLIDRDKLSKHVPRVRAARSVAGRAATSSKRHRTTPPCSPSATRSAPGSTSSPTASSAAKAIPTASRPRSTASTSRIPAPRLNRSGGHRRCRAWSARSGASIRSRCATSSSCAPIPTAPIKMTVPGPFTMGEQCQDDFYKRRGSGRAGLRGRRQCRDQGPVRAPAPTSCRSTSRGCSSIRRRPGDIGIKALDRALDGVKGTTAVHICFGYAAVVLDKPSGYSFLPEFERSKAAAGLDRGRAAQARPFGLAATAVEDHHSRRDRPVRQDGRDARRRWPSASAGRCPTSPAERMVVAPDCGLKYLPRDVAFGKMNAMVEGASIVRQRDRRQGDGITEETSHALRDRTEPDRRRARALEGHSRSAAAAGHAVADQARCTASCARSSRRRPSGRRRSTGSPAPARCASQKRQEFILTSDVLGVSMLVDAINHRRPSGATPIDGRRPVPRPDAPPVANGGDMAARRAGHSVLRHRHGARPRRRAGRRRRARPLADRRRGPLRGRSATPQGP